MSVSGTYWPPNLPKRPNLSGLSIPRTLVGAGAAASCAVASLRICDSFPPLLARAHICLVLLLDNDVDEVDERILLDAAILSLNRFSLERCIHTDTQTYEV